MDASDRLGCDGAGWCESDGGPTVGRSYLDDTPPTRTANDQGVGRARIPHRDAVDLVLPRDSQSPQGRTKWTPGSRAHADDDDDSACEYPPNDQYHCPARTAIHNDGDQ